MNLKRLEALKNHIYTYNGVQYPLVSDDDLKYISKFENNFASMMLHRFSSKISDLYGLRGKFDADVRQLLFAIAGTLKDNELEVDFGLDIYNFHGLGNVILSELITFFGQATGARSVDEVEARTTKGKKIWGIDNYCTSETALSAEEAEQAMNAYYEMIEESRKEKEAIIEKEFPNEKQKWLENIAALAEAQKNFIEMAFSYHMKLAKKKEK